METIKKVINKICIYFLSNYLFDLLFVSKIKRSNSLLIHVIGDSHSSVFSGTDKIQKRWPIKSTNKIPYFVTYHIGAVTAYNSVKYLKKIKKILSFKSSGFNKENDYVMLSFGEIDIRVHLLKQAEIQQQSKFEIMEKCVDRYLTTINAVRNWGYEVIVFGPVASVAKDIVIQNYSSYGTTQERNKITRLFSNYLEFKCKQNKVVFISFFEEMVDNFDNTIADYFLDDIHLSSKALPKIVEKISREIKMIC